MTVMGVSMGALLGLPPSLVEIYGSDIKKMYKAKMCIRDRIITGPKDKGPSRDWLNLVANSEAKNKIRNWFKKERKEENITEGKAALDLSLIHI